MSIQLQPLVPLVTLVKTEPPTVIKNEPCEEALEKEISPDIKDIDIAYHSLSEDLIKNETVPENILENKYLDSVETQVLIKTEDTSDENVTKGTDQALVEVQGSNQYSNILNNLKTDARLVLNFSKDLNGTRTRKAKQPEKTNFAKCYKTIETTSWKKDKEKIKVIKAPVIPVEAHEYISLANDRHICNHCQHAYKQLYSLKFHIRKMHREVTTMHHCPYCPYKSKWSLRLHIIQKHIDTKDIQWFQCNLCETKFKLKGQLTRHMKVHLRHKQMNDGLDLPEKRHKCDKCDYETCRIGDLNRHNLVHLKPEDIPHFHCYHCSYKSKQKENLQRHIFKIHFKNDKRGKRHHCNKCDYKTYTSTDLKSHKLIHLKPEEIQYFYCYHCSCKVKRKTDLKKHIFRHFKNGQVKFDCYICNFTTSKRESIIKHIKKHSKVRIKSEINEGS